MTPASSPPSIVGGYTLRAFSTAASGYSVIHIRPSARYKNPSPDWIDAFTSGIDPTRIGEPNPPLGWGHKNANTAAPNPVRLNPINNTIDRLKNWRRVTPSVSGSGGTYSARSDPPTVTSSWGRRASAAWAST